MSYELDGYGECITDSASNALQIAADVWKHGAKVTTWADGDGAKFDLVWSWNPQTVGRSSILDGERKLYVGVVGCGCFGFTPGPGFLSPDYIHEKLNVGAGITSARLATLIMSVRTAIGQWLAKAETQAKFLAP